MSGYGQYSWYFGVEDEEEEEEECQDGVVSFDPSLWLKAQSRDFTYDFTNDNVWDTREDMIRWARQMGRERMIVLVTKNSNQNMVNLTCDQAGLSRSKKPTVDKNGKMRVTGKSKKYNCPFHLVGRQNKDTRKWTLSVKYGIHNHDLGTSLLGHAYAGRMTEAEKQMVVEGEELFFSPKIVQKQLKIKNPNNVTSRKQISNFKQKIFRADRGNLTVCQWTLQFMHDRDYIVYPRSAMNSDVIDILFFIHPMSLHLLKLFPYLVVMDATYKTNRYNLHLLEIVGMTCTNNTFNIGFAYISNEDTPTYVWVLERLRNVFQELSVIPTAIMTDRDQALINAITEVFPEEQVQHLLCWVHVKAKIQGHVTKVLNDQDKGKSFANRCWGLFMSTSEESYEAKLEEIITDWGPGLVSYVQKVWLGPYKKNIVRAWTDKRLYFFTRTSNRVEGMHKVLKDLLESSVAGFNIMIKKIHHQLESQITLIRSSMEMSRMKIPNALKHIPQGMWVLFSRLIHQVSDPCFQLLLAMYRAVEAGNFEDECVDFWWKDCFGVPCVHKIANCIITNTPIMPSDIHPFWKQVVWEGVTDQDALVDDTIPLSIEDVKWREMDGKYKRGELRRNQVYHVLSSFEDTERPSQTRLVEPPIKPGKGRPKGSTKHSTRDKTYLEHILDEHGEGRGKEKDRNTTIPSRVCGKRKRQSTKGRKGVDVRSVAPGTIQAKFPKGVNFGSNTVDLFMIPFIAMAKDVEADGHCGYRALASVLGWKESEFITLRWELVAELQRNRHIYQPAAIVTPIDQLIQNVNYVLTPCPEQFWMEMPMIGLAFATLYKVALVMLSWGGPHTCLPMMATAGNQNPPTQIHAIALVGNNNHFIPVWLTDGAPLPPPPSAWNNYHHSSVNGWDKPFRQRMELYRNYRIQFGRSPDLHV